MHRDPRVSVVMSVYNAERYLTEAINSILQQTFEDFEFIIVDDGSTDGTSSILYSFAGKDRRIRLYQQTNAGLVASLNRSCCLATAPYIARMDADDISLPDRLRTQFEYLESHPDVGISGTWIQDIGADGTLGPIWPLPTTPATIRWFLMFGNCMAHPTVMSRRRVLERVHYYRSEARYVEDYDLWLRAASVSNLVNIPKVLLRYRIVSDSLSGRNVLIQGQEAAKLRRTVVGELLNRQPADIQLDSSGLWLDLYRIYRQQVPLSRADSSEITLDIFRRACLSRRLGNMWTQLLPYAPRLFSMRSLRKVVRFGLSYGANVRYGFTTQRRLSG